MTDRELMQQALDYLDAPSSKVWAAGTQYKIIQALRARLAEPPCKTGSQCVGGKCERCTEPQRKWQGLTDEEKLALWSGIECDLECLKPAEFARAIEAKLREKNGG